MECHFLEAELFPPYASELKTSAEIVIDFP